MPPSGGPCEVLRSGECLQQVTETSGEIERAVQAEKYKITGLPKLKMNE